MAFVKRVCKICGHDTDSMMDCGRDECEKRDSDRFFNDPTIARPAIAAIHDHCWFEKQSPDGGEGHGLCTVVGCMGESVPLGLVNPDITTGEVPRRDH